MILKRWNKQPSEVKDYDIDFSPWLDDMEDSLEDVGYNITCLDDPDDFNLIIDRQAITESTAKFWIKGGTNGRNYKVTIQAFTVGGRLDESEVIFVIKDI